MAEAEQRQAYLDAVKEVLSGKDPESLRQRRGLDPDRTALYRDAEPAPGAVRGGPPHPWQIRVPVQQGSPDDARRLALEELERGAEGIIYVMDPRLRGHDGLWTGGVEARSVSDFTALLEGIRLDLAPVDLEAGVGFVPAGGALLRAFQATGTAPERVHGSLGADPIGAWARLGASALEWSDLQSGFAKLVRIGRSSYPHVRVARIDGTVWSDGGGGTVTQLVGMLGQLADVLRMLDAEGVDVDHLAGGLELRVPLDPDPFETVIKVRALRWGLRAMGQHLNTSFNSIRLEGFPSRSWLTTRDIHTNLVRLTSMAVGGGWSGLDAMVALPFDVLLDSSERLGRRLARNLHWILREESRLFEVADPGGGAHFVEAQTRATAEAAWERLQALEAAGGLVQALEAGTFQQALAKERDDQLGWVRSRKRVLVGVSMFPNLKEEPASDTRFEDVTHIVEGPAWAKLEVTHLDDLATGDGALWSMDGGERYRPIGRVETVRWAQPFEALRDRSDRHLVEAGQRPRVHWVSLGSQAEHGPRAAWTQGLLEAGGIEVTEEPAPVAVLVGTDERYREEGAETVKRLRAEGARWILVAGQPPEGLADDVVRNGDDVVAFLERVWAHVAPGRGQA